MPELCWMGRRQWLEETEGDEAMWRDRAEQECDGTCFLADGHDGPHEFTPDNDWGVEFIDASEDTTP